jgi:hypothetical protein
MHSLHDLAGMAGGIAAAAAGRATWDAHSYFLAALKLFPMAQFLSTDHGALMCLWARALFIRTQWHLVHNLQGIQRFD